MQYALLHIDAAVGERILEAFRTVLLAVGRYEQRLETPHDPQESRMLGCHIAHVSSIKPAVNDGLRRALGVLPIARHHVLALDDNLAALTIRHDIALVVAYLHIQRSDYSST